MFSLAFRLAHVQYTVHTRTEDTCLSMGPQRTLILWTVSSTLGRNIVIIEGHFNTFNHAEGCHSRVLMATPAIASHREHQGILLFVLVLYLGDHVWFEF